MTAQDNGWARVVRCNPPTLVVRIDEQHVVVVTPDGAATEADNPHRGLVGPLDGAEVIEWGAGGRLAELIDPLWETVGRHLPIREPSDRLLVMAWAIFTLLRDVVHQRPMLVLTPGDQPAAKAIGAALAAAGQAPAWSRAMARVVRLVTTLIIGRPVEPVRSVDEGWAVTHPVVVVDHPGPLAGALREMVLHAAVSSCRAGAEQCGAFQAVPLVKTVEWDSADVEMASRALVVCCDGELRSDEAFEAHVEQVVAQRSAMMSGVFRLLTRVLRRLGALPLPDDEPQPARGPVPSQCPVIRGVAVIAVIADELVGVDPRWVAQDATLWNAREGRAPMLVREWLAGLAAPGGWGTGGWGTRERVPYMAAVAEARAAREAVRVEARDQDPETTAALTRVRVRTPQLLLVLYTLGYLDEAELTAALHPQLVNCPALRRGWLSDVRAMFGLGQRGAVATQNRVSQTIRRGLLRAARVADGAPALLGRVDHRTMGEIVDGAAATLGGLADALRKVVDDETVQKDMGRWAGLVELLEAVTLARVQATHLGHNLTPADRRETPHDGIPF